MCGQTFLATPIWQFLPICGKQPQMRVVAGTNLTALMTAHSTGVKPGELKLSFTMSDLSGHWYVSDLNLDV